MKTIDVIVGIILAVLVTAFPVYSQTAKNVADLTTQSDVIRNETTPGGNTRGRIADMYQSVFLSSPNIFAVYSNPSWIGSIAGTKITYSGASPTTTTVGGLASGSAISGLTYDQILQSILVPYVNPNFASFGVTGEGGTVEVGYTVPTSRTATWSINLNSGVVPTIDIYNVTTSNTLLAGTPNDGSQAFTTPALQLNSNGATQQWRGAGNNTSPSGTFNSGTVTTTARYYRWWAPSATSPANSAAVRALASSSFHTGSTTFVLVTGNSLTKFVVALPPGVTISSVIDTSALGADITANYVLTGTVNVVDAGGTNRAYNIYEMNIGAAYPTSHNHSITIN